MTWRTVALAGVSSPGLSLLTTRYPVESEWRLYLFGIQLQGRRSPLNFATVYESRNFLKKKLSVSLYFYDMFWKRRKMEATIYDDTFHRQDISYSPTRTFGIGISYRFGNLKDAIKKVKRGIKNDDVKALESGS